MERLSHNEIENIVKELKETGKYQEYADMILDDFEEHKIVYKLSEEEIIAIAHKNNTVPFKMLDYYDWQQITYLMEEDAGFPG